MNTLLHVLIFIIVSTTHVVNAKSDFPAKITVVGPLGLDRNHVSIEILKEAYKRIGIDMELIFLPTGRARIELAKGLNIDATLIASSLYSDEYPNWLRVPIVISYSDFNVITRKDYLGQVNWQAISEQRVIYVRGMLGVESKLNTHHIQKKEAVLSIELALKMLDAGRANIALLPKESSQALMQELQLENVMLHEPEIFEEPMYHFLNDKHDKIVVPLCTVIAQLLGQKVKANNEQC